MLKISIIGAGAIGSAVALDLVSRDEVAEVRVCDAGSRRLKELHGTVSSKKVRSYQVDGRDETVLRPILEGSDCVVACASPELNPDLARLSIQIGSHFCDLGGSDAIVREELDLHRKAHDQGVWVVPNCGLAPGLINLLCLLGVDQFESVDSAHLRVGDVPLEPEPPFNFRISASANKLIDDYTLPAYRIQDGEIVRVEPLSFVEDIIFDAPFGRLEAFCTAGSLTTLAGELQGRVRTLDMKTIRWPGHANQMSFLLGLGFGEKKTVDVRTHLTYRDVLVRRLQRTLGEERPDAVLLRAAISGRAGGAEKTLVYEMVARYDDADDLSAMRKTTSIPTASIAFLLATGTVEGGGAAAPEIVLPRRMLYDHLLQWGLPIQETWYDGTRTVSDPHGYALRKD